MNWNYTEHKPPEKLSEFIECIWWEDFSKFNPGERPHLLAPDKSMELIFTDKLIQRTSLENQSIDQRKSQFCGLRTRPQICTVSESPIIGVRFKPINAYRLAKISASKTINSCLDPAQFFGDSMHELTESVLKDQPQQQRVNRIEKFFENYIEQLSDSRDEKFEQMIAFIESSKGTASVNLLSEKFKLSLKTIERKFKENLGITPKKYARIIRFVDHFIGSDSEEYLEYFQEEFKFYDQAHFIKEVRFFTGLAPTTFNATDKGVQEKILKKKSY